MKKFFTLIAMALVAVGAGTDCYLQLLRCNFMGCIS